VAPEGPAEVEVQTLHPKPTEDPMTVQAGQHPAMFHIMQSGIVLQAHLDLFERGIARKLDFSYSGPQGAAIPMIALLTLARRREVIGSFARAFHDNHGTVAAAIVLALNLLLVLQIAGVPLLAFASAGWRSQPLQDFTKFYLVSLAEARCPSLSFPGMR
jgi:hypothetical protein